ncbi:ABC-2 family transporter protein [Symmachiella macrocystis]|uniref:ABC-2 family transporter protein n=1 Tax=Symmachiella macrocystis TaxID=2527985 RepID=A0A5C6BQU5_9PLAN|nr:ABC transporter permease subunit [Symmachiella macrocystis]TWU14573.1 ABC-2 family transporter protein [Symmachiella macrocystis]
MFSAVLRRELVTPLRRRRMIVFQIAIATLFALLIAARWPTDGQVALLGARSQQIFRLFGYGLMATLLLLLPVFPAASIVSEKISGTLGLLFNTPLGPVRIFFAKLLASLSLAGMILAMSLPAAGACYSMGGLSLYEEIGKVYLLLLLVALQYTAIGLLVSSYAQSVDSAIRITYGIVLVTCVLTLGPHYFFQGTEGSLASLGEMLRSMSPLAALTSLTGAADIGGQGLMTKTNVMGQFTVWSLLCTVVTSVWTISRLNHKIFDKSRASGTMSDDLSKSGQLLRRIFFLVDPQKRSQPIPLFLNPVMVKEFRCRKFGRLNWLLRLVAVCAMLSLGLTYATTAGTTDWGVETIGGIMVVMQVALIVLIAPSLSAGLLSTEREFGSWQLLQTTPLSMTRIIWGKLLSAILPLMLLLCATMPGYMVIAYIEPGMSLQVQRVIVCLVLTAFFAMSCSAAVGCFFRRSAVAIASAYGVLLSICCLPLLVWMGKDAPFGHRVVETALSFSSIAAAFSAIRMPGFDNYDLIPANWWFMGIGSLISLIVLPAWAYHISKPQ